MEPANPSDELAWNDQALKFSPHFLRDWWILVEPIPLFIRLSMGILAKDVCDCLSPLQASSEEKKFTGLF